MMNDKLAIGIELLQNRPCGLGLFMPVSTPMHRRMPENLAFYWKRITANRTVLFNVTNGLFFQFFQTFKSISKFAASIPIGREIRPVFRWPNRQLFICIIHQLSVCIQKFLKHRFFESFYTGLQSQLRVFPAHINGIKLNAASLANIIICSVFSHEAVCSYQSLLCKNELSGLLFRNRQHKQLPRCSSQLLDL